MNWDRIEGNWKMFRGKVLQQWGKLTEDELDVIKGRRDVLAGRLQELYGISQDEAERQIERFQQLVSDDSPKRADRGTRDEARAPQR